MTLITNFKPTTNITRNFNLNNKNKINPRNFLLFLRVLTKFFNDKSVCVFVKPRRTSNLTILRSPYRHKLTRHQLTFNRFSIDVNLRFPIKSECLNLNNNSLINTINEFKKFLNSFETNVCNQHKYTISFKFKNSQFFEL